MAITSDGSRLALAARDGRLRILDLASGRVRTFVGARMRSLAIGAFSPNGHTLSTSARRECDFLGLSAERSRSEILEGHSAPVGPTSSVPTGGRSTPAPKTRRRWSGTSPATAGSDAPSAPNSAFLQEELFPPAFDISPDGRTLAAGEFVDGGVDLIDAETLRRTGRLRGLRRAGRSLAIEFSPDGRRLAVAGAGGGVGVWDARVGQTSRPAPARPAWPGDRQPPQRPGCSLSGREGCSPRPGWPAAACASGTSTNES